MWDRLYPFFVWAEATGVAHAIRQSKWTFAITEVLHLLALTLLLGTVLIMAMRLFGLLLPNKTVADLSREFTPWSIGALALVLSTGVLLLMSEATKCWGNPAFKNKMLFFFLALTFQFTVLRIVTRSEETRFSPVARKITAVVAVVLWFSVGAAGRAIAFY